MRSSAGVNFALEDGLEPLLAGYRARPARPADAFGLRAVELRAIRLVGGGHYRPLIVRSWVTGLTLEHYEAAINGDTTFEIAVDLRGHIVGFSRCGRTTLDGVFVEPQLMGKGLGSALLARAERMLIRRGVTRLEIEVPLGAIAFFTHRGYRIATVRERPTSGGFLMMLAQMTRDFG